MYSLPLEYRLWYYVLDLSNSVKTWWSLADLVEFLVDLGEFSRITCRGGRGNSPRRGEHFILTSGWAQATNCQICSKMQEEGLTQQFRTFIWLYPHTSYLWRVRCCTWAMGYCMGEKKPDKQQELVIFCCGDTNHSLPATGLLCEQQLAAKKGGAWQMGMELQVHRDEISQFPVSLMERYSLLTADKDWQRTTPMRSTKCWFDWRCFFCTLISGSKVFSWGFNRCTINSKVGNCSNA